MASGPATAVTHHKERGGELERLRPDLHARASAGLAASAGSRGSTEATMPAPDRLRRVRPAEAIYAAFIYKCGQAIQTTCANRSSLMYTCNDL